MNSVFTYLPFQPTVKNGYFLGFGGTEKVSLNFHLASLALAIISLYVYWTADRTYAYNNSIQGSSCKTYNKTDTDNVAVLIRFFPFKSVGVVQVIRFTIRLCIEYDLLEYRKLFATDKSLRNPFLSDSS